MTGASDSAAETIPRRGSTAEVFAVFLRLGLTSFGGPVAHLGYFHEEFVVRRRWLDEKTYVDLVALSQFLPGPASSKVGIAIGLSRAGYLGALAAWTGFTMPSAIALVLFGYGVASLGDALLSGWLHGLKVAAVAVVAQAVLSMIRALAPDRARATLAVVATVMVLALPPSWGQVVAIVFGGVVGLLLLRAPVRRTSEPAAPGQPYRRNRRDHSVFCAADRLAASRCRRAQSCFAIVRRVLSRRLAGVRRRSRGAAAAASLRGAARLGGNDAFLAGYGAAQAVPGPLFTFSAYLGTVMHPPPNGWAGAIALPGRHVPPRLSLGHRSAAVLGRIAPAVVGAGHAARGQRRRCRVVARRALPSGLELGDRQCGRFRARRRRLPAAVHVEDAALAGGRVLRRRR